MTRLALLGVATIGGVIAFRCVPRESRHRLTRAVGDWMTTRIAKHMDRMMANLPESAPPKLVMSVLPKLQAQNEQIIAMLRQQIAMLRQQNELLRQQQRRTTR